MTLTADWYNRKEPKNCKLKHVSNPNWNIKNSSGEN